MIGVLLDHHGEIMIVRPSASRPAVSRPSLLPSSIQLLRCTAEAVPRVSPWGSLAPAVRWSVGSARAHGSGGNRCGPGHETTARGPACEPSVESRVGPGGSSRGWTRTIRLLRGLLPKSEKFSADEGGGDEETRTPDPLLAKEMLCQLSYVPAMSFREVVGAPGLEPGTSALSGPRSNQLSYAPLMPGTRRSGTAAAP